jgi:hypothetical protein
LPAAPDAGVRVFQRAGLERSRGLARYVAGREGFHVADEERGHFVVVDDLQQLRPPDRLSSQQSDAITVGWSLRPAKAS